MLDILLQHQHIVRMFFTGHVYPEIPGYISLIITDVAPESGLGLALGGSRPAQMGTVVLMVRTPRGHRRVLRRGRIASSCSGCNSSASLLELLHVIEMLVTLHVDAQISLGGGGIITDFAPVGLVPAGVGFSAG